jgi:hypothetical protein
VTAAAVPAYLAMLFDMPRHRGFRTVQNNPVTGTLYKSSGQLKIPLRLNFDLLKTHITCIFCASIIKLSKDRR